MLNRNPQAADVLVPFTKCEIWARNFDVTDNKGNKCKWNRGYLLPIREHECWARHHIDIDEPLLDLYQLRYWSVLVKGMKRLGCDCQSYGSGHCVTRHESEESQTEVCIHSGMRI